jgi:hypothetical protein
MNPNFNFSPGLFLGLQELDKFQNFILDKMTSFIQAQTATYGLVTDSYGNVNNNFLVSYGSNNGTIKIGTPSSAIDAAGNIITIPVTDNILVGQNGASALNTGYYWLKISYIQSVLEQGKVTVDGNGNVTGVGTNFLSLFRAGGQFPTTIKFFAPSGQTLNNILEYQIQGVTSDTQATIVSSSSIGDSNVYYAVVGTFAPGQITPSANKYPFNYDYCQITPVFETQSGVPPLKNTGYEFYIARVYISSGVLTQLTDERSEFYSLLGETYAGVSLGGLNI